MTAVALTLTPVPVTVRTITAPMAVSLDELTESAGCSCAGGDDNPN
jgi:hypothetical protein